MRSGGMADEACESREPTGGAGANAAREILRAG
jgi:hypothetical protein